MAEVKNNFIKSKMNKDLDARLVPVGEYRNAINAQISRSEGEGVGSLENVLGNYDIATFEPSVQNLAAIGYYVDQVNNFIYVFLTDNSGSRYEESGVGSNHFVYRVDPSGTSVVSTKLLEGPFLNFSKLNPIYGVNLLETLLFWTDNKNQPRRINVTRASSDSTYYTTEDQISVAQYNPYDPIYLWKEASPATSPVTHETTMKDVTSKFMPGGGTAIVSNPAPDPGPKDTWVINSGNFNFYPNRPVAGQEVGIITSSGGPIVPLTPPVTVINPSTSSSVKFSSNVTILEGQELVFFPNPYYDQNYAGDSAFLEDKFVRFSYRFKFENNEYSLVAPFTQVCFIPKQDGYFLSKGTGLSSTEFDNDQVQAVSSSIVSFMENKVNSIGLQVPLPSAQNALISNFKITEIDILYKESDALTIKVVETIQVSTLTNSSKFYEYIYTGKKPYKTLLEKEIARVYDKVPVRAFSQESSGNRIIYSNFQNRHTPPNLLDYSVAATEKSEFNLFNGSATSTSTGGIVAGTSITITNKIGSIAIGSIVTSLTAGVSIPENTSVIGGNLNTTITLDNSVTLVNPCSLVFTQPASRYRTSSIEYPNHNLKTNRSYQVGVVLSDRFGRTSDVILSNSSTLNTVGNESFSGPSLYSPYIDEAVNPNSWRGNSLKVLFNTPIGPSNPDGFSPGLYNGDASSSLYNPLGWYSYKIVVQQKEQEYYNVYAPGAIKGTLAGLGVDNNVSRIILINDNINKVPRDLSEVGPQDKTFRSSVQLMGRVQNNADQWVQATSNTGNEQYFPKTRTFTTNTIQPLFDAFDWPASGFNTSSPFEQQPLDNQQPLFAFYNSEANPFLAEITTAQIEEDQFGAINLKTSGPAPTAPPYVVSSNLAILETKPVVSLLDIYYETTTSGLISDLNTAILNDLGVSDTLSNFNFNAFNENIGDLANINSSNFQLIDNFGSALTPTSNYSSFVLLSAFDQQNPEQNVLTVTGGPYFELVGTNAVNSYNVRVTSNFVNKIFYGSNEEVRVFTLTFRAILAPNAEAIDYTETIVLGNTNPEMYRNGNYNPIGDIFPASIDIGSLSAPYSTSQPLIKTLYGRNGANVVDNPNTMLDLTWDITNVADSDGDQQNIGLFETEVLLDPNTPTVSTCFIKNALIPANSIPNKNYVITVELSDAFGAIRNLIINLFYRLEPSILRQTEYFMGGITYPNFVEAQFSGLAQGNGFYIYTDSFANLVSSQPFGGTTIQVGGVTSTGCPSNPTSGGNWYYSSVSFAAARALVVNCYLGSSGVGSFFESNAPINGADQYGWEII